ncbi:hypothetical protein RB653_010191 [Dictyostelium firmibasis]|uniref:CBS domain-containing protein n=1 Tax=Dictyostelium firmibasis TaxID=79012 RepID=A0AAN7TJQ3_9MYCE
MTEDYLRLFSQTAIADLDKNTMISIKKSEDVEKLLSVLYENSLSSLPVIDGEGKRVIGFVDTNDVLSLLTKLKLTSESTEDDIRLYSIGFLNSNVNNIMDEKKKDQFVVVLEEQSLFEVLKLYANGVHRLALLTVFSDIENIVSQSNVIKFLNNNLSVLGPLGDTKIGSTLIKPFLPSKESLITTKSSTLAIDSFKIMNTHKCSAIPVLEDSTNKIIGTLSVNDLYGINQSTIKLLLNTTVEFIDFDNNKIKSNKNKPNHQIVLKLGNTFKEAIQMISNNKVHRIWIVDDNNVPISLISLTDICKIIVEAPYLLDGQETNVNNNQVNK